MSNIEQSEGLRLAKRVILRLLKYMEVDKSTPNWCMSWKSAGHRDAYYLLSDLWSLRRRA